MTERKQLARKYEKPASRNRSKGVGSNRGTADRGKILGFHALQQIQLLFNHGFVIFQPTGANRIDRRFIVFAIVVCPVALTPIIILGWL